MNRYIASIQSTIKLKHYKQLDKNIYDAIFFTQVKKTLNLYMGCKDKLLDYFDATQVSISTILQVSRLDWLNYKIYSKICYSDKNDECNIDSWLLADDNQLLIFYRVSSQN